MSEADTRDLVVRALTAFNAGDQSALLDCLSEDIAHDRSDGGREIGREKFRWFLALRARHFREEASDIVVMTAPGGVRAAAEFTLEGTYLATAEGLPEANGQRYRLTAGFFCEVDDERISRLTLCLNQAALLAELENHAG